MAVTRMFSEINATPSIMVVDDNPVNVNLLSAMLAGMDVNVTTATNGLQAVDLASDNRFDLILMDLQMPLMDGYQAAAIIRAAADQHQPRIVAVTATLWEDKKTDPQSLPFDEIIAKPIDLATLQQLIHRWLKAPNQPSSGVRHSSLAVEPVAEHSPALDAAGLKQLLNQYPAQRREQLTELVSLFLESSEQIISRLKKAVAGGDQQATRLNAHALKSSCGNLAAISLMETCAELERGYQSLTKKQQLALLTRIQEQYIAVKTALLKLINH